MCVCVCVCVCVCATLKNVTYANTNKMHIAAFEEIESRIVSSLHTSMEMIENTADDFEVLCRLLFLYYL